MKESLRRDLLSAKELLKYAAQLNRQAQERVEEANELISEVFPKVRKPKKFRKPDISTVSLGDIVWFHYPGESLKGPFVFIGVSENRPHSAVTVLGRSGRREFWFREDLVVEDPNPNKHD